MTRKEWRDVVEGILPTICATRGFKLTWTGGNSPAAELELGGTKVHVAPAGLWFLGTKSKNVESVMDGLKVPDSVLRGDPCNLGLVEPYRQPTGHMAVVCEVPASAPELAAVVCEVPASAPELAAVVDAIGDILQQISQCGSVTAALPATAKVRRRGSASFEERCELAVVIAESIVGKGLQGRVSPHLTGRVFGIADFAPIVGATADYQQELKSRKDSKPRGEHVVPCKVVTELILTAAFHQLSLPERVGELRRLLKVVYISGQEQQLLDRKFGLKDRMPNGHSLTSGCISARFTVAKLSAVEPQIQKVAIPGCGCGTCGI